jgi:hypothetical protein
MSIWKITKSKVERGTSCIIGPKDPDFVEALKEALPASGYKWIEWAGAWVIRDEHVKAAQRVIDTFTPGATPTPDPPNLADITGFVNDLGNAVSTDDLAELGEYFHAGASDVHGTATTETMVAVRVGKRLVVLASFEVSS